jgi:hypothetical protein
MKLLKMYLAHPVTANTHHVEEWKDEVERACPDVIILDPVISCHNLHNDDDWRRIIRMNVADIAVSNLVVAYLDTMSWGVISECNIAHVIGVPVIGFRTKPWKPSPYERNCVRQVFDNIGDIAHYVDNIRKFAR